MRRGHRQIAHFAAPALFLLGVTIVVLIVHGSFSAHSSSTTTTATTASTTATTSTRPVKTRLYTIRSGDTFGAVAIRFRTSVDQIMILNPGVDPTALRVGQKIKVPKVPKAPKTPKRK